jgi:hypothetical protein
MEGQTTEAAPPPDTQGGDERSPYVPRARFDEVNETLRTERRRAKQLEADLAAVQPKVTQADELAALVAELQGKLDASAKGWAEERAILAAGVFDEPDEAIELARGFYSKLAEDKRPGSLVEYVQSFRAEGAEVPRALQAYLRQSAPQAPAAKTPLPKIPTQPTTTPSAAPALSHEAIRALRTEAQRTGDWTKVQAAIEAIGASRLTRT